MRLDPVAPRSRVKHSTTEPLCSHKQFVPRSGLTECWSWSGSKPLMWVYWKCNLAPAEAVFCFLPEQSISEGPEYEKYQQFNAVWGEVLLTPCSATTNPENLIIYEVFFTKYCAEFLNLQSAWLIFSDRNIVCICRYQELLENMQEMIWIVSCQHKKISITLMHHQWLAADVHHLCFNLCHYSPASLPCVLEQDTLILA